MCLYRESYFFVIWLAVALAIKGNTLYDNVDMIQESEMKIHFNEMMTMPNITFCMGQTQAWNHFRINKSETAVQWDRIIQDSLLNVNDRESFLNPNWKWDDRMIMETYSFISMLTSMERETHGQGLVKSIYRLQTKDNLAERRRQIKFWLKFLKDRNVSFEEFIQRVGAETFRRLLVRFERPSFNDDEVISAKLRITWISLIQFCFQPTFDAQNSKPINHQGNFFIMQLSHDEESLIGKEVECMGVDFHGRSSSTMRFKGSSALERDGYDDEHCLGMYHTTTVEVKTKYKMSEKKYACRNYDKGKDNESDCFLRCRLELIMNLCKCIAPTLSYLVADNDHLKKLPLCDYLTCKMNKLSTKYSDTKCTKQCLPDCEQFRYFVKHKTYGRSLQPNLTSIYLNWGSFEYPEFILN